MLSTISTHETEALKNKNSPINEISAFVLKSTSDRIAAPLTFSLFYLFQRGLFHQYYKKNESLLTLKSGPNNNPNNYHPISDLNIFSKIFESLMIKYLMNYLRKRTFLIHYNLVSGAIATLFRH